MKFVLKSIEELPTVASSIIKQMSSGSKVAFLYGDLGAGKTTLVKEIAKQLGSDDDTSSPTYSLVNEYSLGDDALYHIDLYRVNDTHEAIDMGIEEYLESECFCFVEWPQVIEPLVDEHWQITVEADENGVRTFTLCSI